MSARSAGVAYQAAAPLYLQLQRLATSGITGVTQYATAGGGARWCRASHFYAGHSGYSRDVQDSNDPWLGAPVPCTWQSYTASQQISSLSVPSVFIATVSIANRSLSACLTADFKFLSALCVHCHPTGH
jgi:hypothetical protein